MSLAQIDDDQLNRILNQFGDDQLNRVLTQFGPTNTRKNDITESTEPDQYDDDTPEISFEEEDDTELSFVEEDDKDISELFLEDVDDTELSLEDEDTDYLSDLDMPAEEQEAISNDAAQAVEKEIVVQNASTKKRTDLLAKKANEIDAENKKSQEEASVSEQNLVKRIEKQENLSKTENRYIESFLSSIDPTFTTREDYLKRIAELEKEIKTLREENDENQNESKKKIEDLESRLAALEDSQNQSEESKKSIYGVLGPLLSGGAINFLKDVMNRIWVEFRKNLEKAWKDFYAVYIETIPAIWSIISFPLKKTIQKISEGVKSVFTLGLQMIKGIGASLSSYLGWFTSFGASLSNSARFYLKKMYESGQGYIYSSTAASKFAKVAGWGAKGLKLVGSVIVWTAKAPLVLINGVWQLVKNPLGQLLLATVDGYKKLLVEQPFLLKIILDNVMVGRELACEKISNMLWEATYVETPETLQKQYGDMINRVSDIAGQTVDYGSWIAWEGARGVFTSGTFTEKFSGISNTMQSSVSDSIDSLLGGVQGSAIAAGSAGIGSVGLSLLKNGTGFFIGSTMTAAEKAIGAGFNVMYQKSILDYNINYWYDFFMKDCFFPRTYEQTIQVDTYFDWLGFGEGPNPVPKTQRQINIERAINYRDRFSEDITKLMHQLDSESSANSQVDKIQFKKDFSLNFVETMIKVFETELNENKTYLLNRPDIVAIIEGNLKEFQNYKNIIEQENKLYLAQFDSTKQGVPAVQESKRDQKLAAQQLLKESKEKLGKQLQRTEEEKKTYNELKEKVASLEEQIKNEENMTLPEAEKASRVRIVRVSEKYYTKEELNKEWENNIKVATQDNKLLPIYKEEMLSVLENRINNGYWKEIETDAIKKIDYFGILASPADIESEKIKGYRRAMEELEEKIAKNREVIRSKKNQLEILQDQRGPLSDLTIKGGFAGLPENEKRLRIEISELEIENIRVGKQFLEYEKLINSDPENSTIIENVFDSAKPSQTPAPLFTGQPVTMTQIKSEQQRLESTLSNIQTKIQKTPAIETQLSNLEKKIVDLMNIGKPWWKAGFILPDTWMTELSKTIENEQWWTDNATSPKDEIFIKGKSEVQNNVKNNIEKYRLLNASKRINRELKISSKETKRTITEIEEESLEVRDIKEESIRVAKQDEIDAKKEFLLKNLIALNQKAGELDLDINNLINGN